MHIDLCGPMEELSLNNSKYMFLLKDDYSNYRIVYFLQNKSEVHKKLKEYIIYVKTQTGKSIKTIRSDNSGEFVNEQVKNLLKNYGIQHQLTVAYTPQQNGRAEREFRTIIEGTRSMLAEKKMEKKFWAEAANTAVYLLNRTGIRPVAGKSPYEVWHNKTFELKSLRGVFGNEVWAYIPKEKRQKLDMKSRKGIFVGYPENVKGYRVYFPDENVVTIEREVLFTPEPPQEVTESSIKNKVETVLTLDINKNDYGDVEQVEVEPATETELQTTQSTDKNVNPDNRLRPRHTLKRPTRHDDYEVSYFSLDEDEPTTYEEAMASNHAREWEKAINEEMQALLENNTWKLEGEPEKYEAIDSKWIFKIKRDENGRINKYKCRLVARGYQQQNVSDIVYAPVVKLNTMRSILSVSVRNNWVIYQMDVCSAFLHGEIEEDLYIYLPENCKIEKGKVSKLNKAIYGLKKAPLYWYGKIDNFMYMEGYVKRKCDSCLYIKVEENVKV